tara:strand:+ start:906 stop:1133 length:228 start_codon:yes stop_codon:yes gene_type:complete
MEMFMLMLIKRWMAVPLLLISSLTLAAEYEAGVNYDVLADPVPVMADGKVHVEEAFWYGCPHCFHLDESLSQWVS